MKTLPRHPPARIVAVEHRNYREKMKDYKGNTSLIVASRDESLENPDIPQITAPCSTNDEHQKCGTFGLQKGEQIRKKNLQSQKLTRGHDSHHQHMVELRHIFGTQTTDDAASHPIADKVTD